MQKKSIVKAKILFNLVQCCVMLIMLCSLLAACSTSNVSASDTTEVTEIIETTKAVEETKRNTETQSSNSSNKKEQTSVVRCEVDDCYKEGRYTIVGFSGEIEYYCYTHYNEIQDMIDSMLNGPSYGDCDNCGRPAEYKWDERTAYCEACYESLLEFIYNN